MMARRQLLGGAVLGGWLGAEALQARPAAAAQLDDEARRIEDIVGKLGALRDAMVSQSDFHEIAAVRDQQKQFLRAQGKFPDFIEVGTDVWFDVYDWHLRNRLVPTVGTDASGRYTITLLTTTVIMRPDMPQSRYVGLPYDAR